MAVVQCAIWIDAAEWLPIVAYESGVYRSKTDCDDGGRADLSGDGRRVCWERVADVEVVTEMGV